MRPTAPTLDSLQVAIFGPLSLPSLEILSSLRSARALIPDLPTPAHPVDSHNPLILVAAGPCYDFAIHVGRVRSTARELRIRYRISRIQDLSTEEVPRSEWTLWARHGLVRAGTPHHVAHLRGVHGAQRLCFERESPGAAEGLLARKGGKLCLIDAQLELGGAALRVRRGPFRGQLARDGRGELGLGSPLRFEPWPSPPKLELVRVQAKAGRLAGLEGRLVRLEGKVITGRRIVLRPCKAIPLHKPARRRSLPPEAKPIPILNERAERAPLDLTPSTARASSLTRPARGRGALRVG